MASNDININLKGKYTGKNAFAQAERDMDKLGKTTTKTNADIDKSHKKTQNNNKKTSNSFKSLASNIGVFNSSLGSTAGKLGAASGALGGLTAAMGGLPGIAIAATAAIGAFGVMSYQKAVQSQAEWAKFKGVVESAGQSFDNSKSIVKDFAYTAGRQVSDVRTAFQQLTAAGINPSSDAMKGLNEMAIGLRTDMTSAATAYTRIVKGGQGAARTLTKLGITMEEISTGGKVDTAKLNQILEQKFGKAGENYANSAEAAGIRLQTAIDGMMVAFGGVFTGVGTGLQNSMAWLIKGLTDFGGLIYNLFGGAEAWSGAMDAITPALDDLGKELGILFGDVSGVDGQFGMLKPILTGLGWVLSAMIRMVSTSIKALNLVIGGLRSVYSGLKSFYSSLVSAGRALYSIPGKVYSAIIGGISSFSSMARAAGQALYSAIAGVPGRLYSAIRNALPKIQWPSPGDIYNMIKSSLGFGGPPSGLYASTVNRWKSNLTQEGLAAQKAAVQSAYNASPAAQQAANQAKSNMGIFGRGWSLFSGPGDSMNSLNPTYQSYLGSRQDPWNSNGSLTGNCVDMTRGVLQYAAANGASNLGMAMGTWDGNPHVWAMVDGKAYDPARKALDGTWAPPAAGPSNSSNGVTIVLAGPVYGYDDFVKKVQQANDKMVSRIF